jgi:hypothetical protein
MRLRSNVRFGAARLVPSPSTKTIAHTVPIAIDPDHDGPSKIWPRQGACEIRLRAERKADFEAAVTSWRGAPQS